MVQDPPIIVEEVLKTAVELRSRIEKISNLLFWVTVDGIRLDEILPGSNPSIPRNKQIASILKKPVI